MHAALYTIQIGWSQYYVLIVLSRSLLCYILILVFSYHISQIVVRRFFNLINFIFCIVGMAFTKMID